MKLLTEKYESKISMERSCYDRQLFTGILPEITYARGMTGYLNGKGIKIFDYPRFAEPYKEKIRAHNESKSKESGVPIEFIRKSGIRKESLVSEKLKERGMSAGIVCILSVMEGCNTCKPWHDRASGKTFLKPDKSQCIHCYIYFIDEDLGLRYHWNIMQAEYAMDIVFKRQEDLQNIYGELVATAIHTVKPDNISTFLGQKLSPLYQGEVGNSYNVRIEGNRIKHTKGSCSIKMYGKFHKILGTETATNRISGFKHCREAVHRDGTKSNQTASLGKNIYSLGDLAQLPAAASKRYLEFISAFDSRETGREKLMKISTDALIC
jgi:hypothetical protein